MCDYSLQYVASRPAKVGDKLVSTKFSNSITGGFAAVGEPNVAVCLLPGTEVAFEKEVECEHALGFFSNWMPGKKLGEKVARFRQVKKEQPHVHYLDAMPGRFVDLVEADLFGCSMSKAPPRMLALHRISTFVHSSLTRPMPRIGCSKRTDPT